MKQQRTKFLTKCQHSNKKQIAKYFHIFYMNPASRKIFQYDLEH